MRKIRLLLLTAITVTSFSMFAGCDKSATEVATSETVSQKASTVEIETMQMDDKFYSEKEKYDNYIKDNYAGVATSENPTVYSYNITDENGESVCGLSFIYYMDSEKADSYMNFMTKSFPEEKRSKYGAGDDSVVYAPDEESKDDNGNKLPAYIIVRSGNAIWTAYHYEGYEKEAKDFIDSMIKE